MNDITAVPVSDAKHQNITDCAATPISGIPSASVEIGFGSLNLPKFHNTQTLKQRHQQQEHHFVPFIVPTTNRNPFAQQYSQYGGVGQDQRKVKQFKIWFPFLKTCLPLDVQVLVTTTVKNLIGYILYAFNKESRLRDHIIEVGLKTVFVHLTSLLKDSQLSNDILSLYLMMM